MEIYYIVQVEYQGVNENMLICAINGSEARKFARDKFRKERSISTQSYVEAKILHESRKADDISDKYLELEGGSAEDNVVHFKLEREDIDPDTQEIFNYMTRLVEQKSCHEELKACRRVISAMIRKQGGHIVLEPEMFDWEDIETKLTYVHVDPITKNMVFDLKEMPRGRSDS